MPWLPTTGLNPVVAGSYENRFQAAVRFQLVQEVFDVVSDGFGTDEEALGDGGGSQALGQQAQHRPFLPRQSSQWVPRRNILSPLRRAGVLRTGCFPAPLRGLSKNVDQGGKFLLPGQHRDGRHIDPNGVAVLSVGLQIMGGDPSPSAGLLEMGAMFSASGPAPAIAPLNHIVAVFPKDFLVRIPQKPRYRWFPENDAVIPVHGEAAIARVGELPQPLRHFRRRPSP